MTDTLIVIIAVVCVLGWVVTTWIRARNGYPVEDFFGTTAHVTGEDPETLKAFFKEEIARRDTRIEKLEARVQVLERIVTDRSTHLSEEIERLRTGPVN